MKQEIVRVAQPQISQNDFSEGGNMWWLKVHIEIVSQIAFIGNSKDTEFSSSVVDLLVETQSNSLLFKLSAFSSIHISLSSSFESLLSIENLCLILIINRLYSWLLFFPRQKFPHIIKITLLLLLSGLIENDIKTYFKCVFVIKMKMLKIFRIINRLINRILKQNIIK